MKGARTIVLLGVVLLAAAVASVGFAKRPLKDFSPPEGFIPPPLNPAGVELQTKELAPGVYALLSVGPLIMGFHRLNIQNTYLDLSGVSTASMQRVN